MKEIVKKERKKKDLGKKKRTGFKDTSDLDIVSFSIRCLTAYVMWRLKLSATRNDCAFFLPKFFFSSLFPFLFVWFLFPLNTGEWNKKK